jgi:acetyl esterase/lipase
MKKLVFIILTFLSVNSFSQQYSKKLTDINYADDGKAYHLLDIYLPKITKNNYPVVVLIYGSAWFSNNSKGTADINTIGNALLNAGYAIVVPNHRSSSDAKFPAQIQDIKATIRFIRGNCTKYQLDTSFIGITGSSSGGHLSALCGTTNFVKQYSVDSITMDIEGSIGQYLLYSSQVNAVCDWFGPTNFLVMDSCGGSMIKHNEATSPESSLIGGSIQNNKAKCALANPITYIDSTDPPFLIFHGDADQLVPYCESEFLNNALKSAGVQSEYVQVPGGQHYTGTHTEANFSKMVNFFNNISKNDISGMIQKYYQSEVYLSFNSLNTKLKIQGIDYTKLLMYDIVDIYGRKINKNNFRVNEIDISSLKNGVYILNLFLRDDSEISMKFVKS